jgi:hypothetical protein
MQKAPQAKAQCRLNLTNFESFWHCGEKKALCFGGLRGLARPCDVYTATQHDMLIHMINGHSIKKMVLRRGISVAGAREPPQAPMSKHQRVETKLEQPLDVDQANKQTLDMVLKNAVSPKHLYKLPGDILVEIVPFLGLLPAVATLPTVSSHLMKFAPSKEKFLIAPERLPVTKLAITDANAFKWFVKSPEWHMTDTQKQDILRRQPNFIRTMQLYGPKITELTLIRPWEPILIIRENALFQNVRCLILQRMSRQTSYDPFPDILASFPRLHDLECGVYGFVAFDPSGFREDPIRRRVWTRLALDMGTDRVPAIAFSKTDTIAMANPQMTTFVWKPYVEMNWRKKEDVLPEWTYDELKALAARFDPEVLRELVTPQPVRAEDLSNAYLLFFHLFPKLTRFTFGYYHYQVLRHDVWMDAVDLRDRLGLKYRRDEKQQSSPELVIPMRDYPPREVHWQRSTVELAITLAETLLVANVLLTSLSSSDWNTVLTTPASRPGEFLTLRRGEFLIPARSAPTTWSPSFRVNMEAIGDLQFLRIEGLRAPATP